MPTFLLISLPEALDHEGFLTAHLGSPTGRGLTIGCRSGKNLSTNHAKLAMSEGRSIRIDLVAHEFT
jgi:hypothetical protein